MPPAPHDNWAAGDAYETYMGRWSRLTARAFLEWLRPDESAHWLEFGCGTGALTSTICERCRPASVVACDSSEPFVAHARRALAGTPTSFVTARADALPSRVGGFDLVVSGLVLNFLPDPARVLANARDRLRRGGVVASYVWDYADRMEFLNAFWAEAVADDPRAAATDERSRFPLCQLPALKALFENAGLANVEVRALDVPTEFKTFDDYWNPFLRGTGPAPSYVASLNPQARDALRERLRLRLFGQVDRPIRLTARALAVCGIAP